MKRWMCWIAGALVGLSAAGCKPSSPPTPPTPPSGKASAPPTPSASASVAWAPTPDAPFRQAPPTAGPMENWQAPIPEQATLSNGMKLLIVPRTKLPITVIYLAARHGAAAQSLPGLGSFAGEMMEQGTATRSALQLSDDFENLGAEHQAWVDWDSGNLWVKVLSQHFDKALGLMADMLEHPAFSAAELQRQRSQRLAEIAQQADIPELILRNTIVRVTYRGQPYGESLLGTAASVVKYTPQTIRAFHDARFTPDQMIAVVVGDVTLQGATERLEKAFGSWKKGGRPAGGLPAPPPAKKEIVLVDRPGAPQSNIAVAGVGVPRTTKDFDTILVANTILGGMFSSRLNLNLRERHGWTYGARTSFDMRHGPGPFSASAAVDTPNTVPALREMLQELQRFGQAPVTDDELALAKGTLIKSLPGRFESDGSTAASIAVLGIYGLPLDEYRTRAERVQKVTAADVQAAARKYIDVNKMRIFVVGDRAKLEPELQKLDFGPVVVLDAEGKPIAAAHAPAAHSPAIAR